VLIKSFDKLRMINKLSTSLVSEFLLSTNRSDMSHSAPPRLNLSDITYIHTQEGWLY